MSIVCVPVAGCVADRYASALSSSELTKVTI